MPAFLGCLRSSRSFSRKSWSAVFAFAIFNVRERGLLHEVNHLPHVGVVTRHDERHVLLLVRHLLLIQNLDKVCHDVRLGRRLYFKALTTGLDFIEYLFLVITSQNESSRM